MHCECDCPQLRRVHCFLKVIRNFLLQMSKIILEIILMHLFSMLWCVEFWIRSYLKVQEAGTFPYELKQCNNSLEVICYDWEYLYSIILNFDTFYFILTASIIILLSLSLIYVISIRSKIESQYPMYCTYSVAGWCLLFLYFLDKLNNKLLTSYMCQQFYSILIMIFRLDLWTFNL